MTWKTLLVCDYCGNTGMVPVWWATGGNFAECKDCGVTFETHIVTREVRG